MQKDARQALGALPSGDALLKLLGRKPLAAGKIRELRLPNRAQTLVVVGVLDAEAGAFARLELAGRMARAALAGQPRAIGVAPAGFAGAAADAAVEAGLSALLAADFALPSFRSHPEPRRRLKSLQPFGTHQLDVSRIAAVAAGNDLARWLTAMPPNLLTPARYRRLVQDLARDAGLRTRFYDERALKRLGAGAFLAVTAGSATRDAGVLHVQYRPRKTPGAPLALVGKGICFDTGGTNLKAHKGMLDMHTDMAGSAVAFATLLTLAQLDYPRPVDA
ncbi:MAG: hypothetical protein KA224_05740, partial [Steroidobacteraceae bacterium]|nr:hypothetical protein [Steroidobacteraceae bacterium]